MSPVTHSLDEFTTIADAIIKDEVKIVTAQELAQEMNSKVQDSKAESIQKARELVAKIPPGTMVSSWNFFRCILFFGKSM